MQYNLTQKTVDEIDALIHKSSYVVKNKPSEKILKNFFNGPKKISQRYTKLREFKTLVKKGLLVITNNQTCAITDYGRCTIIAKDLGISFLALCALSEVYVIGGGYPTNRFSAKLDGVYSQVRIRMVFALLKNKGHITKKSLKKVHISNKTYLKIKKYDLALRELQKWFVTTCDAIDEMISQDSNIITNIKKNTL